MKTIIFLTVSYLLSFSAITKAQNILTCELDKNYRKKSVFEVKNDENQVVAQIYQQKKNYFIKHNNDSYLIQKKGKEQYVFYDSIFTDTIATITKKNLFLKNIANYSIKPIKKGWKVNEGEDLEMNVKYAKERKVYVIEIHTPVYEENILNLLACYYAIRKCKDIIQSDNYVYHIYSLNPAIY